MDRYNETDSECEVATMSSGRLGRSGNGLGKSSVFMSSMRSVGVQDYQLNQREHGNDGNQDHCIQLLFQATRSPEVKLQARLQVVDGKWRSSR
jgi:hypothetical protein